MTRCTCGWAKFLGICLSAWGAVLLIGGTFLFAYLQGGGR